MTCNDYARKELIRPVPCWCSRPDLDNHKLEWNNKRPESRWPRVQDRNTCTINSVSSDTSIILYKKGFKYYFVSRHIISEFSILTIPLMQQSMHVLIIWNKSTTLDIQYCEQLSKLKTSRIEWYILLTLIMISF